MKLKSLVLSIGFLLIQVSTGYAVMVHYYDENGQIHYVNTAVARVPERYMDQVRPQIEAAELAQDEAKEDTPMVSSDGLTAAANGQTPVRPKIILDVLITSGCKGCMKLFSQLRANKIFFRSHNVETSSIGKQLLQQYNNMPLPITIIGDQAVSGANILRIKEILKEMESDQ